VWADTLLHVEQQHELRLLLWSGLSIVGGTALGVILVARRVQSALLAHFAIQTVIWGMCIGAIAGVSWHVARLRDVSGSARLEHIVWLCVGLDVGCIVAGAVLLSSAWLFAKRMGAVGAGTAIVVQGLALLVLELQLAASVSR
jgi:hypothetical protein